MCHHQNDYDTICMVLWFYPVVMPRAQASGERAHRLQLSHMLSQLKFFSLEDLNQLIYVAVHNCCSIQVSSEQ